MASHDNHVLSQWVTWTLSYFHTFGSTWLMKWILFSGPSLSPYCSSPFLHAQLLRAVSGALLQSARSHRCPAQLINSSQQKIVVITARGAAGCPVGLGAHSFPARGRHWPGVSITPSSHVELTRAGNRGQLSPLQPGSVATSTPSCTQFFRMPTSPLKPPTGSQPVCHRRLRVPWGGWQPRHPLPQHLQHLPGSRSGA